MNALRIVRACTATLAILPAVVMAGGATLKGTITSGPAPGVPAVGAVVMIEGPSLPVTTSAPHATMAQHELAFVPSVLAIPVGSVVEFTNRDPVLHNVHSASPAKRFDLGMTDQGESRSVTFDTPGVVEVRCNAHPAMRATVFVHTNPYTGVTDSSGRYTISGVPPGSYQVRIWHEDLTDARRPVVLREGQVEPLDVSLTRAR